MNKTIVIAIALAFAFMGVALATAETASAGNGCTLYKHEEKVYVNGQYVATVTYYDCAW